MKFFIHLIAAIVTLTLGCIAAWHGIWPIAGLWLVQTILNLAAANHVDTYGE